MRFNDFIHFIKQIFFPSRKKVDRPDDSDEQSSRIGEWMEWVEKKLRRGESVGTAISLLLHGIVLLILSWLFLPIPKQWEGIELLSRWDAPKIESLDLNLGSGGEDDPQPNPDPPPGPLKPEPKTNQNQDSTDVENDAKPDEPKDENRLLDLDVAGPQQTVGGEKGAEGGLVEGGGYEGRNKTGRGRLIGIGDDPGGRGENAVEKALAWIAAHQITSGTRKGSWSFHFDESCNRCSHGGTHGSRVAATALALLPFLGAGYTDEGNLADNPYKHVVGNGLRALMDRAVPGERGYSFDLHSEQMYSHGIATIALCEAYAMTRRKPKELRDKAQGALQFIEEAQNRKDGGWRYLPNQPGDLSVTAWQIMALKSGKLAELNVSQATIYGAIEFLDDIQTDGGRRYNYLLREPYRGIGEDSTKTCDATGLLLRMYLGWKPGDRMLDDGIEMVALPGPLKKEGKECNLYFAYYATLAMHHYDSSNWRRWNGEIREFLVQTQGEHGYEAGSWYFPDHYCDKGGRLLNTVLATLILETPYRIMPLFRKDDPN